MWPRRRRCRIILPRPWRHHCGQPMPEGDKSTPVAIDCMIACAAMCVRRCARSRAAAGREAAPVAIPSFLSRNPAGSRPAPAAILLTISNIHSKSNGDNMKFLMTAIHARDRLPRRRPNRPAQTPDTATPAARPAPHSRPIRAMASKADAAPTATAMAGWTAARAWPHRANVQARRRRRPRTRKGMTAVEAHWVRAAALPAAALDLRQWQALRSRLISQ